jgi:glycosyltransferase involved in cell wall biosynthesis
LQCIKFVKTLKFDIELIHGHFATRAKLSAALTGKYLNVPVTVTGHAADIFVKDPDWLKIILNRMDHVITISEYNSDYLTNNIGICTPVDSIHLGVDVKKFTPHNQDGMTQTIVSVSRLTEKKGLMYNLRAVNQLTDKYPELTYNVIGEGQREDKLRRIISRYGLTDSVKLLGHVSDERLETEIANASMFVLPCVKTDNGNRDGIPVSLMEAMAMETTPISTRISGVPELITHEESGLLIEPRNPEQLAEGISTLIEDPQYRKELGQAARQKIIAEFNLKTQTKELETIFKRVTRSYQN